MDQLELFEPPATVASSVVPTVESVRQRIEAVLDFLRLSASAVSPKEAARWRLVVPQMSDWLPPDERDAVRSEFSRLIQGI